MKMLRSMTALLVLCALLLSALPALAADPLNISLPICCRTADDPSGSFSFWCNPDKRPWLNSPMTINYRFWNSSRVSSIMPQLRLPSGQGPDTQPGPADSKITGAFSLHRRSISVAKARISHWARRQQRREKKCSNSRSCRAWKRR